MLEMNISGLDLNLLPPLHALLIERHISRAATRAGMSQPAMSRALARLRHLMGDPLLVRASGGYALTPRAEALLQQLAPMVEQIRGLFATADFNPLTIRRTVTIAASDAQTSSFAPLLMQRLCTEAPGVRLVFQPYHDNLHSRMERGEVDFAFALKNTPLPPSARSLVLGEDQQVLVMSSNHPLAHTSWTLETYAAQSHVTVSIFGDGISEVDALLASHGLTRRIGLTTPSFQLSLATVAATPMIATLSRQFAESFSEPARIIIRPLPFPVPPMQPTLVWSAVKHSDPLLLWLRGHIAALAAGIYQPVSAG